MSETIEPEADPPGPFVTDTVRGVTPQPRGVVPPEHAARIHAAIAGKEAADTELRESVVDALKAGASVREVMKVSGLANDTVQRWGREGGWPTPQQKAARDAAKTRRAEWRRIMETDHSAHPPSGPDDE